jgi:hypothetical protein
MDRRLKEVGALSYISTDTFNNNFFSYSISTGPSPQFVRTGTLSAVIGATSLNCPAGRVLKENGKKLYPPNGGSKVGPYPGIRTYMVGVFDPVSNFSGYINPNDPVFAPYNSDRPIYQDDSSYTGDGTTKNLGSPVLTLGHVVASGDVTTAGNVNVAGNIDIDGTTTLHGKLILNSGSTGTANMASGTIQGSFRKLTVSAANCTSNSIVMLTYRGQNNSGILSAEGMTAGSFQIVSSNTADAGVVMYLIVN